MKILQMTKELCPLRDWKMIGKVMGVSAVVLLPLFILLLLIIPFLLKNCNREVITVITDKSDSITLLTNKLNEVVAKVEQNRVTQAQMDAIIKQNDSLKARTEDFHKVTTLIKVETVMKIDTLEVVFHDTIPCSFIPIPFVIDSPWYFINGVVGNKRLAFSTIQFPNEQNIVIGVKKKWLLGRKEYVIDISNSNPYVEVTGMKNYVVEEEKKWYEKPLVWGGIGFAAGVTSVVYLSVKKQ